MDNIESKIRSDIKQFGWHVMNVLPEGERPPHSYSIGLFATFGHPEIAVAGLPAQTARQFINTLGDEIRDGATFEAGSRYDQIIEGYEVMFLQVAPEFYEDNFGRAIDYYKGPTFPIVQMVWPDRKHAFPWERRCETAIKKLQPVFATR